MMSTHEKVLEAPPLEAAPLSAAKAPRRGRLALDLDAIRVLAARDLKRFFRQKSRLVGALAQPILFWLLIGAGFDRSFRVAGAEGVGYREYFFPGVIVLVVLFTAIFSTMSVIEDRHEGFLQAVLVAPCSRTAVVLGKVLGGVAIALLQAGVVLALAPLAGFPLGGVDWPLAIAVLFFTAVGLSSIGFALAWWIDSTQGYHAVMFVLLLPLWILSGAMFPPSGAMPWLGRLMPWNPMAYGVAGVRRALAGGHLADAVGVAGSTAMRELAVCFALAVLATALAAPVVSRSGRTRSSG